jgi:hypothetical protein
MGSDEQPRAHSLQKLQEGDLPCHAEIIYLLFPVIAVQDNHGLRVVILILLAF